MKESNKKKVFIAYGGKSSEHDISVITAVSIFKKFRVLDLDINLLYQTRDGEWFVGEELENFKTYKNFDKSKFSQVVFVDGDKFLYLKKKQKLKPYSFVDFVINCFHGGAGEDGRFSGFLETNKIASSVSGCGALSIAMDKYLTKMMAVGLDVSVVDFFTFSDADWINNRERVLQQLIQFDFPVVIKPVSQGSSIGVSLATTIEEFVASTALALKFDNRLMVERAIINKREFNCCVMRTAEGKLISKIDEPVANKVVISFKDKYLSGGDNAKPMKLKTGVKNSGVGMEFSKRIKNVNLTSKQKSLLTKCSRLMYESLDMNGVVRFDFMMDTTLEKFYLGEINAIPGSLGYYFFEDVNLIKILFDAGNNYWNKKFEEKTVYVPTIF